jgi:hypothetical protein
MGSWPSNQRTSSTWRGAPRIKRDLAVIELKPAIMAHDGGENEEDQNHDAYAHNAHNVWLELVHQ